MLRIGLLIGMVFCGALFGEKPFVIPNLQGQLGNQMFQIAAAYSLALENNAELVAPDLPHAKLFGIQKNYEKVFFRVKVNPGSEPIRKVYSETVHTYQKIPYTPYMKIVGYFTSDKFFSKHKKEVLALFSPHPDILNYLTTTYKEIVDHPVSVAVHVRTYIADDPDHHWFPFLGWDYFKKAMSLFPEDALFVICSDRVDLCEDALQGYRKNMVFIDDEPYYHDLFLMSLCKHNIISNSTFSWWAAYLNTHPEKIVIAPDHWYTSWEPREEVDLIPDDWIILKNRKAL